MKYNICSICGNPSDDGGLKNGEFVCHECLDQYEDHWRLTNKGNKVYCK